MASAPVIEARALSRAYAEQPVLIDVSLRVNEGERVALMGPSGSGKTTLLNCLGGVDRPDRGEVFLLGRRLNDLTGDALAELRRSRIGTIFQFFHLLPTLTIFENVELPLQLVGVSATERSARVTTLLERVGLLSRKQAFPGEMSGGEQQRVAVARALVHHPSLILADEPTGNLDTANGASVLQLLRELTDETHTALLLVTHSAEAAAICHRTVFLRDGRIDHASEDSPAVTV
ncbi:MAG TPA: ABC transporter ATP-binding protein [Opitutaceae bacterium]|nr:ABC transporter ATP-binding protein [Opitutaceae bacterium]